MKTLKSCHLKPFLVLNMRLYVSCDVERSFPKFKYMLRDNSKSSQIENLKTHFVFSFRFAKNK